MKKLIKKILFYDRWYHILRKSSIYTAWKRFHGVFANLLYGNPSQWFFVIGVTWTNGKTTTVNVLHHILNATVAKTVMISTAQIKIGDKVMANDKKMSSLDVYDLQGLLALAKAEWCQIAVLEVTSIGLEQHRFEWVAFDTAVLTNITEDHLDYHGTMDNYALAKKKLFQYVLKNKKSHKYAVFPKDDAYGRAWFDDMPFDKKVSYGIYSSAMVKAENVREEKDKTICDVNYLWGRYHLETNLLWSFNIQNILAALSVCVEMWADMTQAIAALNSFAGIPGRMEEVLHNDVHYYIDFAHSPDALEKTLGYLAKREKNRLIVLFGAPGNRDKGKRPKMWAIVHKFADIIVVTDDDPDTEDRDAILSQVVKGIPRSKEDGLYVIPDREKAIAHVVDIVQPGDVVLLAGKGHETVQWTNQWHRPWSDKGELEKALQLQVES